LRLDQGVTRLIPFLKNAPVAVPGIGTLNDGSEQRPDTRGDRHRECSPKGNSQRTFRHVGAADPGGHRAQ